MPSEPDGDYFSSSLVLSIEIHEGHDDMANRLFDVTGYTEKELSDMKDLTVIIVDFLNEKEEEPTHKYFSSEGAPCPIRTPPPEPPGNQD